MLLARKLISLHPWFDKAKFTRSGGEANALAIRLARSNTEKHICGYHGWHDWYLSANLEKKIKFRSTFTFRVISCWSIKKIKK